MSNRTILNLVIYEHGKKCWLNGVISRDNPLTAHHIVPLRDGGLTIEENIAPITKHKHEAFNELERLYPDLAAEITHYLINYKGHYDQDIIDRINKLLALVERKKEREKHNNKGYAKKLKRR
jgi:hypothetical protein